MSAYDDWQRTWDQQQEAYLPYREEAFDSLIDVATVVEPARVLDLAGGPGSFSLRLLRRLPDAKVTLLDYDPVLLEIARASLPPAVTVVSANLSAPGWTAGIPGGQFDAIFSTASLHCFDGTRLGALYGEVRELLRPGGLFVNADRMEERGLPTVTKLLERQADDGWKRWWERAAVAPELRQPMAERARTCDGESADFYPDSDWHLQALRTAGFTESGVLWRRYCQAAVVAMR